MAKPVQDALLVPVDEPEAPSVPATVSARVIPSVLNGGDSGMTDLIERLATNPNVDVAKLERLMQMHERAQQRIAEERFNAAMSAAQQEMRPIAADAENPQTRSRYASYAQLDRALRPIYSKHSFGLSFDTGDCPMSEWVRVLCYVTHGSGFARTYHADIPADGKGAKGGDVMTRTHAVGAAMSYGMRYLLKMIFNVAVGEEDDDGNSASAKPKAEAPAGYGDWLLDLEAAAAKGTATLEATWKASKPQFRAYITRHDAPGWVALKGRAAKVRA